MPVYQSGAGVVGGGELVATAAYTASGPPQVFSTWQCSVSNIGTGVFAVTLTRPPAQDATWPVVTVRDNASAIATAIADVGGVVMVYTRLESGGIFAASDEVHWSLNVSKKTPGA